MCLGLRPHRDRQIIHVDLGPLDWLTEFARHLTGDHRALLLVRWRPALRAKGPTVMPRPLEHDATWSWSSSLTPSGGKRGDCHSAPTVDSPAVVRGLAPPPRRFGPSSGPLTSRAPQQKNRKPPLSRRRSFSASGEDSEGTSMTTGRINSGGMTKRHMHCLGRPLDVASRPGRGERAGTYREAHKCRKIDSDTFQSVPRPLAHLPVKQAPR